MTIRTKTVFVLGAGCSKPFGFPLGSGLKLDLLEKFVRGSGAAVNLVSSTRHTPSELDNFLDALKHSGLSSVDALLERRPHFLDIGKATMGMVLLQREAAASFWPDGNWLEYLHNRMIGNSLEEFADNQVTFITFNYDRVVEHYFFRSLQNAFGSNPTETLKVISQIPIIHLHGRLGYLPWQPMEPAVKFGHVLFTSDVVDALVSQIKVVHEEIVDGRDKDFAAAKKLLSEAQRTYLIGFGFGERNIERLGLREYEGVGTRRGTAFGLTANERSNAMQQLGGSFELFDVDNLEFMRSKVGWS